MKIKTRTIIAAILCSFKSCPKIPLFFLLYLLMSLASIFAQSNDLLDLSDCLFPGENLYVGGWIYSRDRGFHLVLQDDGNLCLYNKDNVCQWASGTENKKIALLAMQGDGNLVMYDSDWKPVWYTSTGGRNGSYLRVQDDGNLVIYPRDYSPTNNHPSFDSYWDINKGNLRGTHCPSERWNKNL